MRSDATGDWQYFGPNEVPTKRQTLKRTEYTSPVRSSHSEYYGPSGTSRYEKFFPVDQAGTKTLQILPICL